MEGRAGRTIPSATLPSTRPPRRCALSSPHTIPHSHRLQVGAYLYVSQLEMVDSQPEPSTAEIITQRLTASLDSLRAQ